MSGLKINTLNPDWPKMIAIAASSQIDHPQLDLFDGHFIPTMGWLFFFLAKIIFILINTKEQGC